MKDGKKILLKNQNLRILRFNTRKLLYEAYIKKHTLLTNNLIQTKKIRRKQVDNQTKAQLAEKINNFIKEKKKLEEQKNKSILRCGSCNTLEGDRVYYKRFDKWYCPKCYEEGIKHWGPSDWEPTYPLSKNQILIFFEQLEKVVGQCKTNFDISKEILTVMDISKKDQKIFLDTLYHYGGHCDCEIMLNALESVLADFNIKME